MEADVQYFFFLRQDWWIFSGSASYLCFFQMLRAHNDFFASAFVLLKLVSLLHVYKVGSFPLEIMLVIENRQLSVPVQHSFLLCCLGIRLNQHAVKEDKTGKPIRAFQLLLSQHPQRKFQMSENFRVWPKKMYAFLKKKKNRARFYCGLCDISPCALSFYKAQFRSNWFWQKTRHN